MTKLDSERFELIKASRLKGFTLGGQPIIEVRWRLEDRKTGKVTYHRLKRHAVAHAGFEQRASEKGN